MGFAQAEKEAEYRPARGTIAGPRGYEADPIRLLRAGWITCQISFNTNTPGATLSRQKNVNTSAR